MHPTNAARPVQLVMLSSVVTARRALHGLAVPTLRVFTVAKALKMQAPTVLMHVLVGVQLIVLTAKVVLHTLLVKQQMKQEHTRLTLSTYQ